MEQQQQVYPHQQQLYPQQQQPNPQQQYQQPLLQPQFVTQQPAVTIVTQNPQPSDDKFQASALSQMRGLSIMQLVMGILCMIFGIVLLAIQTSNQYGRISGGMAYISYGIWIGAYFILLGAIGLGAVKSNTSCWIISAMVLNIISSCIFWLTLLIHSSAAIAITESYQCRPWYFSGRCNSNGISNTFLALNSLMLIMAIAELVISIWAAALCCGTVCRCCKAPQGQVVSYNSRQMQTQQPVMVASGVPAANPYVVYPTNAQPGGPTQFAAQPMAMQQPVGYVQPQGPPSYYTVNQPPTAEITSCDQPPPTAYPTKS